MKRSHLSAGMAISAISLASCIIATPRTAEAAWFGRRDTSWSHPRVVVILPFGASRLRFGDGDYYYCRGRYYKHIQRGYEIIPAPVGAVVQELPAGHRTIVINGITYHEYDGIYYRGGPAGYTVVPIAGAEPQAAATPAIAGQPVPAATAIPSAAVVNVSNKNGSYTPVSLQMAGNGMYIGPQGEIYPNLPTAGQLQAMYGK